MCLGTSSVFCLWRKNILSVMLGCPLSMSGSPPALIKQGRNNLKVGPPKKNLPWTRLAKEAVLLLSLTLNLRLCSLQAGLEPHKAPSRIKSNLSDHSNPALSRLHPTRLSLVSQLELETNLGEVGSFTITEKAPTLQWPLNFTSA